MIEGNSTQLLNNKQEPIFPVTSASLVYMNDGKSTVEEALYNNMKHTNLSLSKYIDGEEIKNTFFEDKVYNIDSFKLDGGSCVLVGNGTIKTTIKSNSTIDYLQPFQFINKEKIVINDLTFEAPNTSNGESIMLIKDSNNVLIENITLITTGGYSIYFENCKNVIIKGSKINKGSLWFENCENVLIDGNLFEDTYYDSIKAQGNNFKITNNTFNGSLADAVDCYANGQNIIIDNNYIENCSEFGIQLKTVLRDNGGVGLGGSSDVNGYNNRVIVSNNIIKNSPYGVMVKLDDLRTTPENNASDMPKYIKIESNLIENCSRGVYGKHINLIEVNNNTIIGSTDRAIMFSEGFYDCVISNNFIENCKDGIYLSPKTTANANGNKIENNKLISISGYGILYRGEKTSICNNSIKTTNIGIQAMYSNYNSIIANVIDGAITVCIDLTGNFNNSILNSNMLVNGAIGLRIGGVNANSIYSNNISINNESNFINNSTNMNNSVVNSNINISN